jgi:hypothetical protein
LRLIDSLYYSRIEELKINVRSDFRGASGFAEHFFSACGVRMRHAPAL